MCPGDCVLHCIILICWFVLFSEHVDDVITWTIGVEHADRITDLTGRDYHKLWLYVAIKMVETSTKAEESQPGKIR